MCKVNSVGEIHVVRCGTRSDYCEKIPNVQISMRKPFGYHLKDHEPANEFQNLIPKTSAELHECGKGIL